MGNMFNGCTSLFSLPDINKWDTTGVTNFDSLFFNCSSLTILPDILKFNTSNITNMKGLFYNCSSLTVLPDISSWDTSNVTNMGWLFCGCVKLVSLPDISKWDTSKVINMQNMFSGCESIIVFNFPPKFILRRKKQNNFIRKKRYIAVFCWALFSINEVNLYLIFLFGILLILKIWDFFFLDVFHFLNSLISLNGLLMISNQKKICLKDVKI